MWNSIWECDFIWFIFYGCVHISPMMRTPSFEIAQLFHTNLRVYLLPLHVVNYFLDFFSIWLSTNIITWSFSSYSKLSHTRSIVLQDITMITVLLIVLLDMKGKVADTPFYIQEDALWVKLTIIVFNYSRVTLINIFIEIDFTEDTTGLYCWVLQTLHAWCSFFQ